MIFTCTLLDFSILSSGIKVFAWSKVSLSVDEGYAKARGMTVMPEAQLRSTRRRNCFLYVSPLYDPVCTKNNLIRTDVVVQPNIRQFFGVFYWTSNGSGLLRVSPQVAWAEWCSILFSTWLRVELMGFIVRLRSLYPIKNWEIFIYKSLTMTHFKTKKRYLKMKK